MSIFKTVATWNIQRGRKLFEISRKLFSHNIDVALLQECDVGMARSGNVHVPRSLADGLELDHRSVVEFEEDGLGNFEERSLLPGQQNIRGLHCNAILAEKIPRITHQIELTAGREWTASDQPREGGRVALAVKIDGITFVNVHFESRTTAEKRGVQMHRLFKSLDKIKADRCVIGGDFNNKFGYSEPLFDIAALNGFHWKRANVDHGRFAGKRLDWFFYRNVEVRNPQTIDATGISDHDLMTLDVLL